MTFIKIATLIVLFASLSGCATSRGVMTSSFSVPPLKPGTFYHTVKYGETLWAISRAYGVDIDTLVKLNSLEDRALIERGRYLLVPKARVSERAPASRISYELFEWPLKGYVINYFGANIDMAKNKGIDIRADAGQGVKASRSGKVVFRSDKLKGFGKTVILDHGDGYQTVYAYNSRIVVNVGDRVEKNAVVALSGETGRAREPSLHFEIRKNGAPQNPFYYLTR